MNIYRDSTFTKNDIEGSKTQLFSYKFINKAGYVYKTDDIDKISSKKLTIRPLTKNLASSLLYLLPKLLLFL